MGIYKAKSPNGRINIPGIYVVGDLKDYFTGAIMAAESIDMEIMEGEFGKLETP